MRGVGVMVACVTMLGSPACFSPAERDVTVRPILIRVVDATSGEPIAGITVSYAIETIVSRRKLLGIVPALEPDTGPKVKKT